MLSGQLWLRGAFGALACLALSASMLEAQALRSTSVNNPAFANEVKVTADDGADGDLLGYSVSLHGDTLLVGARGDNDNGGNSGSAYVYVRSASGSGWVQQAKLLPDDGAEGDLFGHHVSLSGDTALVGAWKHDANGADSGAAYVFVRNGTTWTQQAKLLAGDGDAGDLFGWTCTVYGDTALIGAFGDNDNGNDSGSAYVFVRSGTSWSQEAKLTPDDGAAGDLFGKGVTLAGDTAVITSRWDDDNGEDSGSAYVFERSGTTWSQTAKVVADDGEPFDIFGRDVWISGDTFVVGAPGDDDNGIDSGSAYVFVRNGANWDQQAKLLASDGLDVDTFGKSVSISGDRALITAPNTDDSGNNSGAAYIFERTGSSWNEIDKLLASDGEEFDNYGWDGSIQGGTAALGNPRDDDNGMGSGSAYIYEPDGLILAVSGTCPGDVTISLTNAPTTLEIGSVNAANNNGFTKGGALCNGTQLEIGEPFQLPPTWIKADAMGKGSKTRTLDADRCWIESMALANCETSGAVFVD